MVPKSAQGPQEFMSLQFSVKEIFTLDAVQTTKTDSAVDIKGSVMASDEENDTYILVQAWKRNSDWGLLPKVLLSLKVICEPRMVLPNNGHHIA